MSDAEKTIVVGLLALIFLLLLVVGLVLSFDLLGDSAPDPKPHATPSVATSAESASSSAAGSAGAAGGSMLGGLIGGGGLSQPLRVYTSGTRLEELLGWTSVEATEALYMYILQMEGEEQEALFNSLPQVVDRLTGLDNSKSNAAWLIEQSALLREPGKNVRLAQQIDQKVCALLLPQHAALAAAQSAASTGMGSMLGRSPKAPPKRSGVLFDKLLDGGGGTSYTFLADGGVNYKLPHAVKLALAQGHFAPQHPSGVHLIPELFLQRLQMQAPHLNWAVSSPMQHVPSPGARLGAAGASSFHLVLRSWEYFLFCFCLWPLSEAGDIALDTPSASTALQVVAGVAGKVGLGGSAVESPLYIRLLKGYLGHFIPIGGQLRAGGDTLIGALSQFWLCQNPSPAAAAILTDAVFQPTTAALLNCIETVVLHINEHERMRVHAREDERKSCHLMLRTAMYHFFQAQLEGLPDISARVAKLIRVAVLYLQPWHDSTARKVAAAAPEAAGTAGATTPAATSLTLPAGGEAGAWEWAPFVLRYYLLLARLLTSVAKETASGRFNLNEKRDVLMLQAVFGLFESKPLLQLMRNMSQAVEHLYNNSLLPSSPYYAVLFEQLEAFEDTVGGRRKACESAMPNAIYRDLDGMDKKLQSMGEELRTRNPTSAVSSSVQSTIESLRLSVQHALRELLPPGREIHKEEKSSRYKRELLLLSGKTPLTLDERRKILHGGARCSALKVPFRATPRLPIRPVGSSEIRFLVELTERLAPKLPPALLEAGLHPRMLASYHAVVLLVAHVVLLCMPTLDSFVLRLGWYACFVAALTVGLLVLLQWRQLHKPSEAIIFESWAPWVSEQLARGTPESDISAALVASLPSASAASVDRLLTSAKRRNGSLGLARS
ncbi:hypothetical protein AB1Y20_000565 [Prymnesium parvum]|uniref:Transmembrane protein n=1 Tax=Prymnesium parvum TaxID=97485 RepID=A0AB34K563_PRYPA